MKRIAGSDLNQDNWNEEEDPEDVGTFEKATDSEMKSRIIRTAKRRLKGDATDGQPPKTSVFSSFSGFAKTNDTAKPAPALAAFSFGKKPDEPATKTPPTIDTTFKFGSSPAATVQTAEVEKSAEYCSKLKELNSAFLKCIQKHVDSGRPCILTPVLNDYIKSVNELDATASKPNSSSTPAPAAASTFTTGASAIGSTNNTAAAQPKPFSFGGALGSSPFSIKPSDKPSLFGATFGATAPTVIPSQLKKDEATDNKDEDEEDTPPKVEFTPVVESDSLYDIRCKVFVKKDSEYASRGTGTLYLKSAPNDKVQLLVRADTNLGNILINFLLSAAIPAKRMGKNNVMMVCIPTPEDKAPQPILLRVKNEEEADKLLEEITKRSKWIH